MSSRFSIVMEKPNLVKYAKKTRILSLCSYVGGFNASTEFILISLGKPNKNQYSDNS